MQPGPQPPNDAPTPALPAPVAAPATHAPTSAWDGLRQQLIRTLPPAIVNHSSNIVGAIQMVAEMLMFKSSGNDLMTSKPGARKIWSYLTEPPANIVRSMAGKSKLRGSAADLLKPSFYWRELKDLGKLESAAIRDSANGTAKLTNRWSARSGFVGSASMLLATLLPDRKETPEETEEMARMAHDAPLHYAGHRMYQAVNPLEWVSNKRQAAGLGMVFTGLFSALSGFRQVEGKFLAGPGGANRLQPQIYRRNLWQTFGGMITAFAGGQLLLAINNQQGWTRYGTTQLARVGTLPFSIGGRFKANPETGLREQGAAWYFAAQTLMVIKNATASLIGGGHKTNDGTVIDHAEMRREASEEVRLESSPRGTAETPRTQISAAAAHNAGVASAPQMAVGA